MSVPYTYESLKQMRGQVVKDIWHEMIGKEKGLKNTTGLKTGDEIIQAILEGQQNPEYLEQFKTRNPKPREPETIEMPPKQVEKKKPGPKPKPKPIVAAPVVPKKVEVQAVESNEIPLQADEIKRHVVRRLHVGDAQYFLETKTNCVFQNINNRPGDLVGQWNPETRKIE